jgi:hypothetical protein
MTGRARAKGPAAGGAKPVACPGNCRWVVCGSVLHDFMGCSKAPIGLLSFARSVSCIGDEAEPQLKPPRACRVSVGNYPSNRLGHG